MDKSIEVQGPRADVVVVYRGIERETYSCTPNCERRITLGDGNVFFEPIARPDRRPQRPGRQAAHGAAAPRG